MSSWREGNVVVVSVCSQGWRVQSHCIIIMDHGIRKSSLLTPVPLFHGIAIPSLYLHQMKSNPDSTHSMPIVRHRRYPDLIPPLLPHPYPSTGMRTADLRLKGCFIRNALTQRFVPYPVLNLYLYNCKNHT